MRRMRVTGLKLLSVACALIMVLTAFQVVTANASADPLNETAESDPSMHDHRRLTVSNQGAVSPASATSSNGALHVAWAGIVPNGTELNYKSSNDNGTLFSSDLAISPVFCSISNISISCSDSLGVGITFEGLMTESSNATIYLLYSSDGGLSWSQTYQLCEGSSPSVVLDDGYLYLGLTRPYGDSSVFSILNFTLGDDGVIGCTSMITLSIGEGYGKIVGDASAIYYAVRCSSPYDGIIYGSIGYDGVQIDASTLIRNIYSGNVPDLDMVINQGIVFVVWSLNGETDARIQGAVSSSDRQSWTALTISGTTGSYGSVSATAHGPGFFVAWENGTKAWTEISASDLSPSGAMIVDAMCLSTDRVWSSCPSVTANMTGEVSCIWAEAHHEITELFYFRDVLFESLDIYDLEEYVASLDEDIFVDSTARSDLISSIGSIIEDLEMVDDEAARVEVEALMIEVDGFTGGNAEDDIIGSPLVQMRIFDVLSALKDILPSVTTGIKISNLTSTCRSHSVNITWTTSINGTSVVVFGANSSYGTTVTGTGGTSHLVTITGLAKDTTYRYRVISTSANDPSDIACKDSVFTTLADAPTGIVLPPNIIPLNSVSTTITWTTSEDSTTVVEYGANSSYGSIATGTNGTSHSVTITGLSAATSYLFRVRSASTVDSSEIIYSYDTDFTTSAAEITSVTKTIRNSNSVTITWTTSSVRTSVIEYGTSSSYGSTATGTSGTSHSVTITGLSAATTYHFRVRSASTTDPSDIDYSSDRTFTTNAAEITSVTINVRNSNSVIITWTTAASSTSVIEYGTSSSYGSTATGSSGTSHSVTITGLSADATYHFRAMSVISSSSTHCSADRTFTTNSPEISSVTITIDSDSATITWSTSQSSSSVVDYGPTSSYGSTAT
ncbi:MAG: fibronectin type III domain-containing protein, partial [Methanomassiliicoccales archaeon]